MKTKITTNRAPVPAGPYSQGLKVGSRVYVAGQGPTDPSTGKLVGSTIEVQTRQVLKNIEEILKAAGASVDNIVKSTVHLSNLSDFESFNKVYQEFFQDPYPVRTTVQSVLMGILVEIDVIAELGE